MGEESHKTHQELWEKYMEVERRELEQRRSGQLGGVDGRSPASRKRSYSG